MSRLEEITARKQRLVAESDAGRNEMARIYYECQARALLARRAAGLLRNPLVLGGLGLLALKLPWRRVCRVGGWAWRGWGVLKTIQRFV